LNQVGDRLLVMEARKIQSTVYAPVGKATQGWCSLGGMWRLRICCR